MISVHILIYCFWDHYYSCPPFTLALLIDSGQIKKCQNHSECYPLIPTLCDPIDYSPPKLLCPWNSPGKSTGKKNNNNNTGVGCRFLLQGIFLTQGLNPDLLHCRQILYHLIPQGSFQNTLDEFTCNKFKILRETRVKGKPFFSTLQDTKYTCIISFDTWGQPQQAGTIQPCSSPQNLVCSSDRSKVIKVPCIQEFSISPGEWN